MLCMVDMRAHSVRNRPSRIKSSAFASASMSGSIIPTSTLSSRSRLPPSDSRPAGDSSSSPESLDSSEEEDGGVVLGRRIRTCAPVGASATAADSDVDATRAIATAAARAWTTRKALATVILRERKLTSASVSRVLATLAAIPARRTRDALLPSADGAGFSATRALDRVDPFYRDLSSHTHATSLLQITELVTIKEEREAETY
jgi:hypothetical protein